MIVFIIRSCKPVVSKFRARGPREKQDLGGHIIINSFTFYLRFIDTNILSSITPLLGRREAYLDLILQI
jgi:hypothetical protein